MGSQFWELHRRLADCYQEDLRLAKGELNVRKLQEGSGPDSPGLEVEELQSFHEEDNAPPPPVPINARSLPNSNCASPSSPGFTTLKSQHSISRLRSSSFLSSAGLDDKLKVPRQGTGVANVANVVLTSLKERAKNAQQMALNLGSHSMGSSNSDNQLAVLGVWQEDMRKEYQFSTNRRASKTAVLTVTSTSEKTKVDDVKNVREMRALHPAGHFKTMWNMLVAACVLHDLVIIPVYVFDPPENVPLKVLEWMTQIFWQADLIVGAFTGFYRRGTLILDIRKAAWQYLVTWGVFDFLLVIMGWLFIFLDLVEDDGQADLIAWSRTLRAIRFLRFVRVLRWLKLRGVTEAFKELFHSNTAFFYYSLVSAGVRLLILNHLLACCWWGIALIYPDQNWARASGLWDASVLDQYLTSLNWSFAMLGVGLSSIRTTNTLEIAFFVIVAFRSLMTYATLVSSITSLTSALSKIKEDETSEFRLLRSYLAYNNIGAELSHKISRFLQHQYHLRQEAKSAHANVPLLELLSPTLRRELEYARNAGSMEKLDFIAELLPTDDLQVLQVLQDLAVNAMTDLVAATKDVIFLCGSTASHAFLKINGPLSYFSSQDDEEHQVSVTEESWIAEICLWVSWVYQGDLVAEDVSRFLERAYDS
ncbi:Potassium/sodium hyperpolarization-activated cyclic nucleotide-gated channel 2 (Brain cyclic nucleotide-gated channel 2) (BCNG-2) [Durusdinium trenchii]|uniref:Potassium/sodium hyperpolarization-activated cyclic nucleotide-gated channel 2 (Brain cyclic nucleotide-gated channel 2) (BCNG-2) n=1 Tax=Durusdinium trenchii TaxID=1381693 RepID=A0ABP0S003_9DINO